MVADEPPLVGQARLLGVAERGPDPAVGDRHHDVGVGGRLSGELAAEGQAGGEHVPPEDLAVGPREVDVLEDALTDGLGRERTEGAQAVAVDHQQLARLDVPHVLGVDEVEGARLGADDVRAGEPSQHQRAESPRVAGGHQGVLRQEEEREGAHDLREAGRDGVLQLVAMAARVEVEDHLGVGGGLEDRARRFQLVAQDGRVHQVSVVGEGDRPAVALDEDRLGVGGHGVAGRRVSDVAHGAGAREPVQPLVGEHVVDQAHALLEPELLAVGGHDARRLLPPVLERVEPEVGQAGGFRVAPDAEQAAAVVEAVVVDGNAASHAVVLRDVHSIRQWRRGRSGRSMRYNEPCSMRSCYRS